MRRAAKVDSNASSIVDALRAIGCSVDILPGGNGRPDLLVGYRSHNFLFEVKDRAGKLNALQKRWHTEWRGKAHLVRNFEEAVSVMEYWNSTGARA